MGILLIDDLGNFCDCYSVRALNLGLPSASVASVGDYVVAHLGYVEIRSYARGSEIRLRPASVSPKAIASLLYWLRDHRPSSVVLSSLDRRWTHTLIADERTLLMLLTRVADGPTMCAAPYLLKAREPGQTKLGRLIPELRAALQDARDMEELRSRCRKYVGTRYTFFRVPPAASRLVFSELGEGYRNVDTNWQRLAVGLTLEDIGDYHFGRWLAEAHHGVLAMNQPMVDDVDAFVDWPRRGRVRTRYQRLVLPFVAPDRTRWVLSTSTLRNDIDLRAEAGEERGQVGY